MPPREAKGRYLTREYMADAEFWRKHDAAIRELYILLALFSDDAGWLEWDPDYLMYSIYRYEDARTATWGNGIASLQASGRLRIFKCGHALMPRVHKSPRSGEHEYRVQRQHEDRCKSKGSRPQSTPGGRPQSTLGQPTTTRPPNPTLPNPNRTQPNRTGHRKTQESTPGRVSSARVRGGGPQKIGETEELSVFKRRVEQEGGPVKI